MCVALPGRVLSIAGAGTAHVDVRGVRRTVGLGLLEDVRPGDWILVSLGLAVERISAEDATETLRLLDDIDAAALEAVPGA